MSARKSAKSTAKNGKRAVAKKVKSLGAIGPRGLLVHRGNDNEAGYKFYPDNKDFTWRDFLADLPAFAKSRGIAEADVKLLVKSRAPVAMLEDKQTFLINLDAFQGLPPLGGRPKQLKPRDNSKAWAAGDAYLMHEDSKYYVVPEAELEDLPPLDEGDAKVIIKRGTVAAAIPPNDLPIGTHCILLNLTQLLPKQ